MVNLVLDSLKCQKFLELQGRAKKLQKNWTLKSKSSQSPIPRPMAHRAVPISVSIALGHASANAVKATVGSWSTGSSASLTFPLHSYMSSARREGSEYHFKSLWYDSAGARTNDLPVVRQTLYYWTISPVFDVRNF